MRIKRELDDERERKRKMRKKKQRMEHLENLSHDNVVDVFLFPFYSSLAFTLCQELKNRDACAECRNQKNQKYSSLEI